MHEKLFIKGFKSFYNHINFSSWFKQKPFYGEKLSNSRGNNTSVLKNANDKYFKLKQNTKITFSNYIITDDREIIFIENLGNAKLSDGKYIKKYESGTGASYMDRATEKEIKDATLFAIGGEEYNDMYKANIISFVNHLAYCAKTEKSFDFKPIALVTTFNNNERSKALDAYDFNKAFFPFYIEQFVRENILPKLLDPIIAIRSLSHTLKLFSYDTEGGKEILMMANALKHILTTDYKLTPKEIKKISKDIKAFCLDFAVEINSLDNDFHFETVILYNDGGDNSQLPLATQNFINNHESSYINSDSKKVEVQSFIIDKEDESNFKDELLITNTINNRNTDCHSKDHYHELIDQLQNEAKKHIVECLVSKETIPTSEEILEILGYQSLIFD